MSYKIIINSSLAFIIAALLEMTLHEGGHFCATFLLEHHAVLHHNYVSFGEMPLKDHIIVALAGPVVSLFIGIVFNLLLNRKRLRCMNALIALYLSIFGYIGFIGYVMIAPFFSYGDTGYVLNAIGCPMWIMVMLSVLSIATFYFLSKAWSVHFIGLMSKETASNFQKRKRFIYSLVLIPLFIGITVTTLLNLPAPTVLSLIAPLTSPYVILWAFGYYLKKEGAYFDNQESVGKKIYLGWIIVLMLIVALNRILVPGFSV